MSEMPSQDQPRDERIDQIIAEYLQSVENGQPAAEREFVARYPEFATELTAFFADHRRFRQMAAPLADAALGRGSDAPTEGVSGEATIPSKNTIRYLGDYELLDEIARGGMGVVYKARQASLNRVVAVKMILAGRIADEAAVKRFRQEAEAAAKLDHPNIVPIYEVGEHAALHYFSMGYIDGPSLSKKLPDGPLPAKEATDLIAKVARAVHFAHQHGIIHRDLKPGNILLDVDGRPRVTDFGLAKLTASDQSLTETGQALGTPGYMAPEQVSGQAAGPETDVYALGAVLYALLTGRPPFQAATPVETMMQLVEADPVPPRQLNSSVPRDLDVIVLKCLEKRPIWRYPSAIEVAEELERFLKGEPIHARPPSLIERGTRWLQKQRRSVALTAAAVGLTLLLALGAIVGWLGYQQWRLGSLSLNTDHPPLTAQLIPVDGSAPLSKFTVPTQEPIAAPAGDYRLRLSSSGRFSHDYLAHIPRGNAPLAVNLNLDDQLLGPAGDQRMGITVDSAYALVRRQGKADVILLERQGIRHPGWPSKSATWNVPLDHPRDVAALRDLQGFRWPWQAAAIHPDLTHALYMPYVTSQAIDIDGDGIEDVIVAARHQAWVMAISGNDGKILWATGRGIDAMQPDKNSMRQHPNQVFAAVIAPPCIIDDVDGDGVTDLLIMFGDTDIPATEPNRPRRWFECLSGKTGRSLWSLDFDAHWFDLLKGAAPPLAASWHVFVSGYSAGGGSYSSFFGDIQRTVNNTTLFGQAHPVPYAPQVTELNGRRLAVVVCGSRAIGVDVSSGQLVQGPVELGMSPVCQPRVIDLSGNGRPSLLIVGMTPGAANVTQSQTLNNDRHMTVAAWSLGQAWTRSWDHRIEALPPFPRRPDLPMQPWPIVADLDGKRHPAVIVPNSTWSTDFVGKSLPELEVLDGATGQSRWRRRLKSMDGKIDWFTVGPDVDGDGTRDLFIATLFGENYDLYADALSGRDGSTLWWNSQRFNQSMFLDRVFWWRAGEDGWPQLAVAATPENITQFSPQINLFSAGDGKRTGVANNFDRVQLGNADARGGSDLFGLQLADRNQSQLGGKLIALRGSSSERWRCAGVDWQPGADYDHDGQRDLIGLTSTHIVAISARDGHTLWQTAHASNFEGNTLLPLDVDLDGDGTPDVIVYANAEGAQLAGMKSKFPLTAISGRTGKKLWTVESPIGTFEGVLFVEARDLNCDGTPEIVFSTFADWDYPDRHLIGGGQSQHWLATVSGRTGRFRWRVPLSAAYGTLSTPAGHHYWLRHFDLHPAFADLDGDGVTDILMPAEVPGQPGKVEWRAMSGRDGHTLWSRPHDPNHVQYQFWSNTVPPTVGKFDGDGASMALALEYVSASGQTPRVAHLFGVDAKTGSEKWIVDMQVDPQCGLNYGDNQLQETKPRPLILRKDKAPKLIAVNQPGNSSAKIVVLDAQGKKACEWSAKKPNVRNNSLWVCDPRGDGNDILIYQSAGQIQALAVKQINGQYQIESRWEWPFSNEGVQRVLGIQPGSDGAPAKVIVQDGPAVRALSADSSNPIWIISGPQPVIANGVEPNAQANLIDPTKAHEMPLAVFQWGDHLSACCTACPWSEQPTPTDLARPTSAATKGRQLSTNHSAAEDPRFFRTTPWAYRLDRTRALNTLIWCFLLAVMLWILPGWLLYRMIARRQWGMRTQLMIPVAAGLMFLMLRMTDPTISSWASDRSVFDRFFQGLLCVPPIYFAFHLIRHVWMNRWRRVAVWLARIVVVGVVFAVIELALEYHHLGSGERFAITELDVPIEFGFFACSYLAAYLAIFMPICRKIISLVRSRRAARNF